MEVGQWHLSLLTSEVVLVCYIRSDAQCRNCCSQGFVTKQHLDHWGKIYGAWSRQWRTNPVWIERLEHWEQLNHDRRNTCSLNAVLQYLQYWGFFFQTGKSYSVQHIFHMFRRNMALLICKQLLSTFRDCFCIPMKIYIFHIPLFKGSIHCYSSLVKNNTAG